MFLTQKKAILTVKQANDRKCFKQMHMIRSTRGIIMAKCPTCGKEVKTAKKTWKMAGKPDKKGKRTQLTIALYDCCGKTFREVLDKKKI
jgi:hypothetical protein